MPAKNVNKISARTTVPPPTVVVGVPFVERMALLAVRLTGVLRRKAFTPKQIRPIGHSLQMGWVYTFMNSAKMIYHKAGWHTANKGAVRESVSSFVGVAVPEVAVTRRVNGSRPYPTALGISSIYVQPESIKGVQ